MDIFTEKQGFIYFIGIGGISMSSLAVLARNLGYRVQGSDLGDNDQIREMKRQGIKINSRHEPSQIQGADLVVYTAAVSEQNPELHAARTQGIPCLTRAAFLGQLMKAYRVRIGISGTHGKSTTTGMISEIYLAAQANPTIVSGAVMPQTGLAYRIGAKDSFLFEACEYTDSFLSFFPTTSVVLNIELDHVDYFRSMEQLRSSFAAYLSLAEIGVVNSDSPEVVNLLASFPEKEKIVTFGVESEADYTAKNIKYRDGCGSFDFCRGETVLCRIPLRVPGKHNVADALAAATAAYVNGISADDIAIGLSRFGGVARRFEKKGCLPCGATVYDDYAHHPSEIAATLAAAKSVGGRIRCVFQPHSYTRTVALFDDFCHAFSDADEVIFADIYLNLEQERCAHERSAADLAAAVDGAHYFATPQEIAAYLNETAQADDKIILMGAGNIYHVRDYLTLH